MLEQPLPGPTTGPAPAGRRPPPPLCRPETRLAAEERTTPHGSVWLAAAHYDHDYRHGRTSVGAARGWDARGLALAAREARAAALPAAAWAFVDLETTGLGAGPGIYAFLVGIGWLGEDGYRIEQFLLRDFGDEPALLQAVAERLAGFHGLVTFNGKTFDLPLLGARYALARRSAPHAGLPHCDLLPAARRLWAHRTSDRRLVTLESQLLGHRRRHDISSALIPDLYYEYLRSGRPEPLDAILAHNRADLLSLLLLACEASSFVARLVSGQTRALGPERSALRAEETQSHLEAEDRLRVAQLLLPAGEPETARALLAASLAGCPLPEVRLQAARLLAAEHKRGGDFDAACALWEEMLAIAPELVEPYEELAKVEEHRHAVPARALRWVEMRLTQAGLGCAQQGALEHRRARLRRKLEATPGRRIDTAPPA